MPVELLNILIPFEVKKLKRIVVGVEIRNFYEKPSLFKSFILYML